MSEMNDIAGSDDVISLTNETQDTFNEHSYRMKQPYNLFDKNLSNQAKENQKPIEQVDDVMQAETQNYSLSTGNNEVSVEGQPATSIDEQNTLTSNNPLIILPPLAQSTLTDESSISVEKAMDSLPVETQNDEEKFIVNESTSNLKPDSIIETSTTTNDLRLYISPSTSLLETTNVDDPQGNLDNKSPTKKQEKELDDRPKEEPMDIGDAQASLGSDGLIESHPTSALMIESTSAITTSTTTQSPPQQKTTVSPTAKALYSLSQPATNKFETMLAKLTSSPARQVNGDKLDSNVTIREEEELYIKESVSKIVRRYAVKTDLNGRILSRELLIERVVEENTTTRIESWPPVEKKVRRSIAKTTTRPTETVPKKPTKLNAPKRRTKSLKPTSAVVSPKKSKAAPQSDDDEVSKNNTINVSSDDESDDEDAPTDNISGDEFIPTPKRSTGQSLTKGSRVFAKWVDGHFYSGIIGSINGEKHMIDFDDGAKRYVKSHEIISQSYLEADQNVMAETEDGHLGRGTIKRLIKKKKTGKLGYIVEKNGKEKWYPLRFISLTAEQAEHLPIINNNTEETANVVQGKRKRTSNVPQSPNKKIKSSISLSPNKSPRKIHTPTRQTRLFNSMYFLFTGFNDSMDIRHKVQETIEKHGGRVIEKMPHANRRDNVYLISDIARKTAKFYEAKKSNIPCVKYDWIDQSIKKSEIEDWESYKLVLLEKGKNKSKNPMDDDDDED